ncbi:MAG: MotA/TolQ/ExbB proton channel family protein [Clostridium sp.]|nr:MotA/TolQ/ExbB proton channel family protein [Clostridium sp.]
MKKLDILTPVGLLGGIVLLLWGMMSDIGLMIFFDVPSLLITLGGSFAAVLITITMSDLKKIVAVLMQAMKESAASKVDMIQQFSSLSKRARREGLLSLEDEISNLDDAFLKKGLQMVVDGIEPETIREILELEISQMEDRHTAGAFIFATWASYAPAFGMLGTLIGLIQMLADLSDVSLIASGMAKALITTFYGSLIANLFCSPLAANLAKKSEAESKNREMMLEGILAIQSGVNPRIVEEKLVTYLNPKEKEEYMSNNSENAEGVA